MQTWKDDGQISVSPTLQPIDGLFCEQGKRVLQIFQRDNRLHFSDGKSELDVSDVNVRAFYVNILGGEILAIRRGMRPMLAIFNWAGSNILAALNDPTYDAIDFEADRFLLACARLINKKAQQVEIINNWRGIATIK